MSTTWTEKPSAEWADGASTTAATPATLVPATAHPAGGPDGSARRKEAVDPGYQVMVLARPGTTPRNVHLGTRPGRLGMLLVLGWALGCLGMGAGLRALVERGPAPLRLHLARAHAAISDRDAPSIHWLNLARSRVPAGTTPTAGAQDRARDRARDNRDRAQRLGLGSRKVASQLLRGKPEVAWVVEAAALGARPQSFAWPVQGGWFVRGYGSGEDGYHLAVDVGGEEGSAVLAAADGIVAYADDDVRGYGNLLMLVHAGGFVTMYAHNRTHSVAPGDHVRAGDPIATVGNTGISRGPHVHFELMHDRQNCDPVPLFNEGVRHRNRGFAGHGAGGPIQWSGERAPRQVRCKKRRRHPHSRWVHHHENAMAEAAPIEDAPHEDAPTENAPTENAPIDVGGGAQGPSSLAAP